MNERPPEVAVVLDAERGGRLTSLRVDGDELLVSAEEARALDPDGVLDPLAWGAYVMAPWAGRIRDGRFTFAAVAHQLPLRQPPHALHGTVLDRPWRMTTGDQQVAVLHDGAFASCVLDLGDDWPFAGTVRHTVSVSGQTVRCDLEVRAAQTQPIVVGWHPWFRRDLGDGRRLDLRLDVDTLLERDADGMPSRPVPIEGPVTATQDWDDTFVGPAPPALLSWPPSLAAPSGAAHELRLTSSAPVWVVFTQKAHAVCVEPQTAPPNAHGDGTVPVVAAGERLTAWFELAAVSRPLAAGA